MADRRAIAALAVGVLLTTAGCTQLVSGDASFEASESGVEGYEDSGFELNTTE